MDLLCLELAKHIEKIQADHHVWMKDQSCPNVLAASLKLMAEIEKEGLTAALPSALILGMVSNVYMAFGNMNSMMNYLDQLNNHCRASTECSLEANSLMGKASTHLNK